MPRYGSYVTPPRKKYVAAAIKYSMTNANDTQNPGLPARSGKPG
jgi:hypothetical protein